MGMEKVTKRSSVPSAVRLWIEVQATCPPILSAASVPGMRKAQEDRPRGELASQSSSQEANTGRVALPTSKASRSFPVGQPERLTPVDPLL
jgi:hypothetical protein